VPHGGGHDGPSGILRTVAIPGKSITKIPQFKDLAVSVRQLPQRVSHLVLLVGHGVEFAARSDCSIRTDGPRDRFRRRGRDSSCG